MSQAIKINKLEDGQYVKVSYKNPTLREKAMEIIKSYLPPGEPDETYDLSYHYLTVIK